jgi:hypothetical protein
MSPNISLSSPAADCWPRSAAGAMSTPMLIYKNMPARSETTAP